MPLLRNSWGLLRRSDTAMTHGLLAHCEWPDLPQKYDIALKRAVEYIIKNFTILGIIASGTIIRGNPDPASDLDIYVIQRKPFRQRLQKKFNSVPAEIFINPPAKVEEYISKEQAARKPITAHMLSTGFVILKLDPIIDQLRAKAAEMLANPPEAPADLTPLRYMSALLFEDAMDKLHTDPETSEMIIDQALVEMLKFCFIKSGRFIPRQKSLLDELENLAPPIASLARKFYRSASLKEKLEVAKQIAENTTGADCFFEWDSPIDDLS
jgi:hypothetical protein